jgi:tetratricopeptide (TPR) repeat protein
MNQRRPAPPSWCPTSGEILGAVVRAFRLHHRDVGGEAAEFIGSTNAGKTARDYFDGKWVPENTRYEICGWIAQSLAQAALLPDRSVQCLLPAARDALVEVVRNIMFTWTRLWDEKYQLPARRWPRAHVRLARFVLGRQLVIDLASRWVALCEICDVKSDPTTAIEAARAASGRQILEGALQLAGRHLTRDALVSALADTPEGREINDRTVDRWYDELVIPEDKHLMAMSRALSSEAVPIGALLRHLRVRYGALKLVGEVREAVGERLCDCLLDGLARFVRAGVEPSESAERASEANSSQSREFEQLMLGLLTLGSGTPISTPLIFSWLRAETDARWHDDLSFAARGEALQRIEACLKVVGDRPRMLAAFERHGRQLPGDDNARREMMLEDAAIHSMNDNRVPAGFSEWIRENPELVKGICGDTAFEAATHAERATAAMHSRDFDAAIPHWCRAASLDDDPRRKSNYLFHYGACLWRSRSRRYSDAIEALEESFRLWPPDATQRDRPFVEIAIVYQNRGWFEMALRHLEADPAGFASSSGHYNYVKGRTLAAMKRFNVALACFERAIELEVEDLANALRYAADAAFELHQAAPDQRLARKGRDYAKRALHLGRPEAHDRWLAG